MTSREVENKHFGFFIDDVNEISAYTTLQAYDYFVPDWRPHMKIDLMGQLFSAKYDPGMCNSDNMSNIISSIIKSLENPNYNPLLNYWKNNSLNASKNSIDKIIPLIDQLHYVQSLKQIKNSNNKIYEISQFFDRLSSKFSIICDLLIEIIELLNIDPKLGELTLFKFNHSQLDDFKINKLNSTFRSGWLFNIFSRDRKEHDIYSLSTNKLKLPLEFTLLSVKHILEGFNRFNLIFQNEYERYSDMYKFGYSWSLSGGNFGIQSGTEYYPVYNSILFLQNLDPNKSLENAIKEVGLKILTYRIENYLDRISREYLTNDIHLKYGHLFDLWCEYIFQNYQAPYDPSLFFYITNQVMLSHPIAGLTSVHEPPNTNITHDFIKYPKGYFDMTR